MPEFAFEPHVAPVATDLRAATIAVPGFGRVFTDHMALIRYTDSRGWHDAKITARAPLSLDPATSVLHYAQEIFEGLKAYRAPNGGLTLFRPDANARRFAQSAARMAMPELPSDLFVESIRRLVEVDGDWMPPFEGGSLYLRPFMFANEAFLGVKPSAEHLYVVIMSPVGSYWKKDVTALSVWVSQDYTRAAPGGTGAAKCGGNYAASLIALGEASRQGHDQVVFLDAVERRFVEELGGMNVMFVFDDGSIATPPLGGTILPGITRDSLMALARGEGLTVREEPYAIEQWRADAESGRLREAFACGTAAVIAPIGSVHAPGYSFRIGNGGPGEVADRLRARLTSIQNGLAPDPHGWMLRV